MRRAHGRPRIFAANARTLSVESTQSSTNSAEPPADCRLAARAAPRVRSRAATTTWNCKCASPLQTSAPIPPVAPVTMAIEPLPTPFGGARRERCSSSDLCHGGPPRPPMLVKSSLPMPRVSHRMLRYGAPRRSADAPNIGSRRVMAARRGMRAQLTRDTVECSCNLVSGGSSLLRARACALRTEYIILCALRVRVTAVCVCVTSSRTVDLSFPQRHSRPIQCRSQPSTRRRSTG